MLPLIIGAGLSAAGSLLAAKNSSKAQSDAAKKAAGIVGRVPVPSIEEARAELEQYVQQGLISPIEAETILQEQTAHRQIEEDPRLRASQIDALTEIENRVGQGGLDARSRADLYQIGADQATQNRGEQGAVLDNARARGVGGADLEFVNRLVAQQGAATRSGARGMEVAAMAEERKRQAVQDQLAAAGNLRDQDYARKQNEAQAIDAINRFNAANRQAVATSNVGDKNAAQAANLGQKQKVADMNTQQRNAIPSELRGLQFKKAGMQADAVSNVGAAQAADSAAKWSAIQGGAQAGGSLFDSYMQATKKQPGVVTSDERAKKDVTPLNPGQLLDELTGYSYKYKPGMGEGNEMQAGVMADDVERAAPGAVDEGPNGMKQVNTGKLGGVLMAGLADLHKRLREVESRGR